MATVVENFVELIDVVVSAVDEISSFEDWLICVPDARKLAVVTGVNFEVTVFNPKAFELSVEISSVNSFTVVSADVGFVVVKLTALAPEIDT